METHSTSDELSNQSDKSKPSNDIEADYGQEEGEEEAYAFEKEEGNILDKDEYDSDVEQYMEAMEGEEMQKGDLKIEDAEDDDEYGSESGKGLDDYGSEDEELNAFDKIEDEQNVEDEEEEIEQVFAEAGENKEMDMIENLRAKAESGEKDFMNKELVQKIEQIEDEMMNPKQWTLTGEANAHERPLNSLLDVHLDFNAATKMPPTITKETTNKIEDLIKQRVLDELFDDPVLRNLDERKKIGATEEEVDFTKSKKGLGDLYADDMTKRLMQI